MAGHDLLLDVTRALVSPQGDLDGWIGGACSEPIVVSYHFCCAGCRSHFEAEPSRYVTATDDTLS